MTRRRAKRIGAWALAAAGVLVLLVWAANVPFYSGASVGNHFNWRMEHGRLRLRCEPRIFRETFYVGINNEGLKFAPGWRIDAWNSWEVVMPLWLPLGVCAGLSAWLFRTSRPVRTGCSKCGYDLTGLPRGAVCPECGGGRGKAGLAAGNAPSRPGNEPNVGVSE